MTCLLQLLEDHQGNLVRENTEEDHNLLTTSTLTTRRLKMAPRLDANRIAELYECTESAYNAELSQSWAAAYSLHETAQKQWSSFASMANFFSRADKVTKSLALRRAELHQQRLNILRPFAQGGKSVPKVLIMHPSKRLTMMGFSERVDLDQLAVATASDLSEQSLPLTTVRSSLVMQGRAPTLIASSKK